MQGLSGAPVNFAVYAGLLKPGARLMGLDLTCGGHLSHGFKTEKKRVSHTSLFWETDHYRIKEDGFMDYDGAMKKA